MKRLINSVFDRFVRPEFSFAGRSWLFFQVCGGAGVVFAIVLMLTLAAFTGLSVTLMGALIVADLIACLALTMVTKIILGEERLTYCHHEISLIVVTALIAWLVGQPVLSYLDVSILGLGLGLACGRVGCLMAGCCHGTPARCGVRYGPAHVAAGFSLYYGGVRFIPIQIIEAIWVAAIVFAGSWMVLSGYPAGMALSLYICAYGAGRFFFEFFRADTDRAYFKGFSESQWISLLLMWLVVAGEFAGVLPFQWWTVVVTAFVSMVMFAVAMRRRSDYRLLLPRHMEELAHALDATSNHAGQNGGGSRVRASGVPIDCTSLGVQISAGRIKVAGKHLYHYALSNKTANMTEDSARVVARLILQLRHPIGSSDLIAGNRGVFHLLVSAP
ncbi:MAG TPA: prolipoprotein diacylglyceryl transferase family protein [Pyrinomonadaceae bacterium]|nr:prolipoprotein diacylglyceryl transferase family protein [Pyrinomonadaceae bacterium]